MGLWRFRRREVFKKELNEALNDSCQIRVQLLTTTLVIICNRMHCAFVLKSTNVGFKFNGYLVFESRSIDSSIMLPIIIFNKTQRLRDCTELSSPRFKYNKLLDFRSELSVIS